MPLPENGIFLSQKRSFAISFCSDFGMRGGLLKPLTKYLYLCVLGKQTVTIKCPDRRVNKNRENNFSLSGPLCETLGFNSLIHQLFCDQHLWQLLSGCLRRRRCERCCCSVSLILISINKGGRELTIKTEGAFVCKKEVKRRKILNTRAGFSLGGNLAVLAAKMHV